MVYIITRSKTRPSLPTRGRDGRPRRIIPMHPDQVREVKKRLTSVSAALNVRGSMDTGERSYQRELQDKPEARKEKKHLEKTLERDRQMTTWLKSHGKDKLWARANQLRDEFRQGMPTKQEMHPAHVDFASGKAKLDSDLVNKTARRHLAWDKRNSAKCKEFKRIMRVLAPDKPELANIETHRPKGRGEDKKRTIVGGIGDVKKE